MDDTLLMGMLDGFANPNEKAQSLVGRDVIFVAVLSNSEPANQLHYEERSPGPRGAGVENARDIRVIHECECLPFRFESCNHTAGVHPWLNNLKSDLTPDRLLLLCKIHDTATSFPNLLEKLVML